MSCAIHSAATGKMENISNMFIRPQQGWTNMNSWMGGLTATYPDSVTRWPVGWHYVFCAGDAVIHFPLVVRDSFEVVDSARP